MKIMASQKVQFRRYAAPLVTAAYANVRLVPQDLRALNLNFFLCRMSANFLNDCQ